MMLLYDEDESKDDHDYDYSGLLVIVSEWSPSEKGADGQGGGTAAGMSSRRAVEAVFQCSGR